VWLVTGGGALFAAFPEAYATVFPGFLSALHVAPLRVDPRGGDRVSQQGALAVVGGKCGTCSSPLAARSPRCSSAWRWVILCAAFLLISTMSSPGTLLGLLNPYALLMGVTVVLLFAMHGAIYLVMKTEGELHEIVRGLGAADHRPLPGGLLFSSNFYTLIALPHIYETVRARPWNFSRHCCGGAGDSHIPREFHHKRDFYAFLSSCLGMALMMAAFGLTYFRIWCCRIPCPKQPQRS